MEIEEYLENKQVRWIEYSYEMNAQFIRHHYADDWWKVTEKYFIILF